MRFNFRYPYSSHDSYLSNFTIAAPNSPAIFNSHHNLNAPRMIFPKAWFSIPCTFDPTGLFNYPGPDSNTDNQISPSDSGATPKFSVRPATTPDEHLNAFRLLHDQFVAMGYIDEHPSGLRILKQYTSTQSHTFIAQIDNRVVGTVTLIEDYEMGRLSNCLLPADKSYPKALSQFRKAGRKLIEVSGLATDFPESNSTIVMELIRAITIYSKYVLRGDDWVITVNPRHVKFYKKVMLFEDIEGETRCAAVGGAPARLLRLNLNTMERRYLQYFKNRRGDRNLYRFMFSPAKILRQIISLRSAIPARQSNIHATHEALRNSFCS